MLALLPDGATWHFHGLDDETLPLMGDYQQVEAGHWQVMVGPRERQAMLELLQEEDSDGIFSGAESVTVEFEGQRLMEGFDGMEFVYLSRYLTVSEAFYTKYFAVDDERVGQAKDW